MSDMPSKVVKPLGCKAYGHICHLPGSRLGPGDHKLNEGQARILTQKVRDKHDLIIVQEKLDGSNVAVAKVGGKIMPLVRAGYPAVSSKYEQHRFFANWVMENYSRFDGGLADGEWVSGEWLAQAHGTRYLIKTGEDPFVAFDLFREGSRLCVKEFMEVAGRMGLRVPPVLWSANEACSIAKAMELAGMFGSHGAIDPIEGCVWRVERRGAVDFLGKYVRPEKKDGCYLPELSGVDAVWNWKP